VHLLCTGCAQPAVHAGGEPQRMNDAMSLLACVTWCLQRMRYLQSEPTWLGEAEAVLELKEAALEPCWRHTTGAGGWGSARRCAQASARGSGPATHRHYSSVTRDVGKRACAAKAFPCEWDVGRRVTMVNNAVYTCWRECSHLSPTFIRACCLACLAPKSFPVSFPPTSAFAVCAESNRSM
jgi:hypothetical protein